MSFVSTQRAARATSHMRRWLLAGLATTLVTLSACGGGGNDVDRGPTTLAVDAKLNGLYWDKPEGKLYLTDDATNAIRVWDESKNFPEHAKLTALGKDSKGQDQRSTLGQLTRTQDGTFYVTRFGFGEYGAVVAVPKSGAAYNLSGTDGTRRRMGITTTPDGALLDGWFRGGNSGGNTGAISELTVTGQTATERDLVTGLGKPVGLGVVGDQLYVSDQNTAKVSSYSLRALRAQPAVGEGKLVAEFLTQDGIDLMTAASDGTLFFGGSGGKLFQVSPAGKVTVLANGWPKVIGVAYDETNRRLFAAVAAADANSTASVRIVPIP